MSQLNYQTTSSLSDHLRVYLEKLFLKRLEVKFHFEKFAKKTSLKKNEGKQVNWLRYTNISDSTTALSEGVSPDGLTAASTKVTATVAGYGQFLASTDFFNLTAVSDNMKDYMELLGYAAGKSLDALIRNEVDANATIQYADAASNSSEANVATGTDRFIAAEIRSAVKTLRNADVDEFEDGLYRGIIHPFSEYDLLSETGANSLVVAKSMTEDKTIQKGEIGNLFGVKFFRSSHIRAVTSTVYRNIITGKDAYGTVDLESAGLKMIAKQLGSAGTEDPLDQRSTVGYKFYFATKILQAARVMVIPSYGA